MTDRGAIDRLDPNALRTAQATWDQKTKPRGSLGDIERVTAHLVALRGQEPLQRPVLVLAAADHGVISEGVSAYPKEVTQQMVLNILGGGAASSVLARQVGVEVAVCDFGVDWSLAKPTGYIDVSLGHGTKNLRHEPAMSVETAEEAIRRGHAIAARYARDGCSIACLGEMGIANTTSAAALTAACLQVSADSVTGRGTGLSLQELERKRLVVVEAVGRRPRHDDRPLELLADLGGFEIAGLVGLILGFANHRVPVLLDGFITGAAALLARALEPGVVDWLIASHQSAEPGHAIQLASLDLTPLLRLDLRLGEGTGALLVLPLLQAGLALFREMATFAGASVSDSGR